MGDPRTTQKPPPRRRRKRRPRTTRKPPLRRRRKSRPRFRHRRRTPSSEGARRESRAKSAHRSSSEPRRVDGSDSTVPQAELLARKRLALRVWHSAVGPSGLTATEHREHRYLEGSKPMGASSSGSAATPSRSQRILWRIKALRSTARRKRTGSRWQHRNKASGNRVQRREGTASR